MKISAKSSWDPPYSWTEVNFLRNVTAVQQRDPLRPLPFAAALHLLAVELQNRSTGSNTDKSSPTV